MNKEKFAGLIMVLAENFGGEPSEALLEMWWSMANKDGITADQFAGAAEEIIRTRKYKTMPTYAEIVEAIHGSVEDKAQVQVDIALSTMQRLEWGQAPKFDDPVTARLMTTRWDIAWYRQVEEKAIPFWRKEFIEAYKSYSRAEAVVQIGYSGNGRDIRQLAQGIGKTI